MNKSQSVKLDDVAEISGGFAFKSTQYVDSGRFVLRTVNIRDDASITKDGAVYIAEEDSRDFEKFSLKEHDTLFVMVAATLGKVGYVRERDLPALLNQNMWVIRARPGLVDPIFLHYQFRELSKIPLAWVSGSARSFLRREDVRGLAFFLPDPKTQLAIGELLKALDDKIELNRRMNETLETMARAIFRDWFVDFGVTRAKMEGRAPYLTADLWSLFPDRIDDATGLPEGWEVGTISDLAVLNPESWGAITAPPHVQYLDLSNVKWGSIHTVEEYEWSAAPSRAKRVLRSGDTIVGCVRPGNGSFALIGDEGLTGSTGFAVLRPKTATDSILVWCIATAQDNIERLTHLADGGAYPAVRPEVVAATGAAIADERLRLAFSDVCRPLVDRVAANRAESDALAKTRDYLLPKLMSGEVRVRDAEKLPSEAA